jgi:hypothetical protein
MRSALTNNFIWTAIFLTVPICIALVMALGQRVRSGGGEADPVAERVAARPPAAAPPRRPEPVEPPRARAYG